MSPDKTKLKELIQKSATKDLMYIHINPVEPKSLEYALTVVRKLSSKSKLTLIIMKN